MALNFELFLIVAGIGFVAAAMMVAVLVNIDPLRDIDMSQMSTTQFAMAIPLAAFGGPYWVARESFSSLNRGTISPVICGAGLAVSLVWSFCAGVFVVEFLHWLQLV